MLSISTLSLLCHLSLSILFLSARCFPITAWENLYGSVCSSKRDMLTSNSPNVFQNHISSLFHSFRQRDDWDVLRLPSVSTLENPAALKTPRLRRSLVTLRGSACSIAGRTSHCKTPFYQLSFRRTGGRGKRVETVTATSLASLRVEYCLFQLVSADFNHPRTVTHKGQKQIANGSKCKRNPDTWMFRFSNGEKLFLWLTNKLATVFFFF